MESIPYCHDMSRTDFILWLLSRFLSIRIALQSIAMGIQIMATTSNHIGAFSITIVIIGLTTFIVKLYKARKYFKNLKAQGLPMPPHHAILGHIPLCASIFKSLPSDVHISLLADQVRRRYPHLDSAFYLDLWPFGPTMLIVICPSITYQFTQDHNLPKCRNIRRFLRPITGNQNLLTMDGAPWKHWRTIFNPGFSAKHILNLLPEILEEVLIFKEIIQSHAQKNNIILLGEPALNMMIDVAGRIVLDHQFNSQTVYNEMTSALRSQLKWCSAGISSNVLEHLNFVRPLVHWYNSRRMNRYLSRVLHERHKSGGECQHTNRKSILDLALQEDGAVDETSREVLTNNIKLFLLAGYDTTAATTVYLFHLLSLHSDVTARLRAEHTAVFGSNTQITPSLLSSNPQLLNQLPLTLAVIKETLRLYPAASTAREGEPDFYLVTNTGRQLPTQKCLVWANHHGLHHNPKYWPRVEEFLPERWLVPPGHELYPTKNAWRPFERGLKNCLGQELALTLMKLTVVLLLRDFEITNAYEEWDLLAGKTAGPQVNGDRAYQVSRGGGGGHPRDFYPCKVQLFEGLKV